MKKNAAPLILSLIIIVFSGFFFVSCSKKDLRQDEPVISPEESGSDRALAPAEPAPVQSLSAGDSAPAMINMDTVYFPFDSDRLSAEARATLKNNAAWMNANPDINVQIEGHCDERGSVQYNMALGERRARVAKNYLMQLGVSSQRLSTLSFGEERPQDSASNERAWARNRRAMFVRVGP